MSDGGRSAAIHAMDKKLPCLNCGYDLRSGERDGFGELTCPECGHENDLRKLHAQGLRSHHWAALAALILAPSILLMLTAYVFLPRLAIVVQSGLLIMLSPAAIGAHGYAAWAFVSGLILRRGRRKTIALAAIALALAADVVAFTLVLRVGLNVRW